MLNNKDKLKIKLIQVKDKSAKIIAKLEADLKLVKDINAKASCQLAQITQTQPELNTNMIADSNIYVTLQKEIFVDNELLRVFFAKSSVPVNGNTAVMFTLDVGIKIMVPNHNILGVEYVD